jgi:cysteine desulfurase
MSDVPPLNPTPGFIYLDNNATTACLPEVVEAMAPYWQSAYGNAASVHYAGRVAHRAVEAARASIADALSVAPHQLFFNSGATEGNNWLFHAFASARGCLRRIVVGATEHKSVLHAAKRLECLGCEVVVLPVTSEGVIPMEAARNAITPGTGLVSVQLANNETGVVQPVRELAALAHAAGAFFHCDAVQGLGRIPVDLVGLGVDSAVFSGHKIHAPKGIGLLYLRSGVAHFPFDLPCQGGGQEQGIRPGTVNVTGVVGLAKAVERLPDAAALARLRALQCRLEAALASRIPGSRIHGASAPRIPNTTNFSLPSVPADVLMANLPLICISNGSACNSGAVDTSYVLKAMGISADEARTSIRVSSSVLTTQTDIDSFVCQLDESYKHLK